MTLVRWVERHRRSLLFVAFALALAGLFAGLRLPVGLFPVISFPRIRIEVDSGSMPARQMLIEITEPLEEAGRAVPGAIRVSSTTSRGAAEIFIDFPWGSDMSRVLLAVDAAFAQELPRLPSGTKYVVLQMSPDALMPFVSYALISNRIPQVELRRLAKYQITPLLTGIPGIRRIGVLGGEVPEVQVSVSLQQLAAYGLSVADIAAALSANNTLSAVGRIEDNDLLYLAVGNNSFRSAAAVAAVTLRSTKGAILRLGDIAKVTMGSVPQWLLVDDNGRPAVTFDVYQEDDADSLSLAATVAARLATFMKSQPKSIHLYKWYDQTELVRSSIDAVEEAILIGLGFAAMVIFGFLRNWRVTLVAMIVVPPLDLGGHGRDQPSDHRRGSGRQLRYPPAARRHDRRPGRTPAADRHRAQRQGPAVLGGVAARVAAAVAKVPGIEPASVNNGVVPAGDALEIHVDPAAAAMSDLTPAEIGTQLHHYLSGAVVTRYLGEIAPVGVRLWLDPPQQRIDRDQLDKLPIRTPDGQLLPLATVARIKFVAGQPQITRDNLGQIVAVTAQIGGGHDLGSTAAAVRRVLERPGLLPAGVYFRIGGAYRQQELAIHGMIEVFAAALLAEFILLLFLYEGFVLPVAILASSLVSTGAVFVGLWLTGVELNITAMMGMVMIVGIATEMAIFFASEYQALARTMPPREALYQAALNRLRPITMSTLAMILALLPLGAAISGSGDQMLQPLAIAIIAGGAVQLPLVLLVLPVALSLSLRFAGDGG